MGMSAVSLRSRDEVRECQRFRPTQEPVPVLTPLLLRPLGANAVFPDRSVVTLVARATRAVGRTSISIELTAPLTRERFQGPTSAA
jgi:hypothetical protein